MEDLRASTGDGISPYQWLALAICVLLQILEGFDVFIVSIVASTIRHGLALSTPSLGLVLSAGLAGMMLGSLLLPGLADLKGRRTIIVVCLGIATVGMALACISQGARGLVFARLLTGLGVGGAMPVVNTAVAELARGRARNVMITTSAAGYPAGGLLAAVVGSLWLREHGWRMLFGLGLAGSLACLLLTLFLLPESVAFLLARQPRDALRRVNRSLGRLGKPPLAALPVLAAAPVHADRLALFAPEIRYLLGQFALATFLTQFSFYFFLSWLPALLETKLASPPGSGAIMLNFGGIAGDALFGLICLRADVRSLGAAMMGIAFIAAVLMALRLSQATLALPAAFVLGASLYGAMASVYSTAPILFPIAVRSAATGVALGLGRLGGAFSPWLGALLLTTRIGTGTALLVMALPLVAATTIAVSLRRLPQIDAPA